MEDKKICPFSVIGTSEPIVCVKKGCRAWHENECVILKSLIYYNYNIFEWKQKKNESR